MAMVMAVGCGECASAAVKKTRRAATTKKAPTRKSAMAAIGFDLKTFCEHDNSHPGCGRLIKLKSVDDIVDALAKAGYTRSESTKETVIFFDRKKPATEVEYICMTSPSGDINVEVSPLVVRINLDKSANPTALGNMITRMGYKFDCGGLGDEYSDNFGCSDYGTRLYDEGQVRISVVDKSVDYGRMNGFL